MYIKVTILAIVDKITLSDSIEVNTLPSHLFVLILNAQSYFSISVKISLISLLVYPDTSYKVDNKFAYAVEMISIQASFNVGSLRFSSSSTSTKILFTLFCHCNYSNFKEAA